MTLSCNKSYWHSFLSRAAILESLWPAMYTIHSMNLVSNTSYSASQPTVPQTTIKWSKNLLRSFLKRIISTGTRKPVTSPCMAHTINIVVQMFLTNLALREDDEADNDVDDYSDDEDEIYRVPESPTVDELASISSLRSVINKIRAITKSIRGSTQKWERFQKVCDSYKMKSMTIPLDITVRWNSTFRMLHQVVYLRHPIHRHVDDLRATQI
jgi:hypothetical protein